jgi:hypothetical protein
VLEVSQQNQPLVVDEPVKLMLVPPVLSDKVPQVPHELVPKPRVAESLKYHFVFVGMAEVLGIDVDRRSVPNRAQESTIKNITENAFLPEIGEWLPIQILPRTSLTALGRSFDPGLPSDLGS